jgi:serine/threonine protein kinase
MPELPVLVDRYELREQLGAGASGAVYRAHDRVLGREIAIKWMLQLPTPEDARRFRREASLASSFRHPDVIEVFDVGEHDGKPYLAMELVTVPSLASALVDLIDPPTIAGTVKLATMIAVLISSAHAAGVVHRDLKPANVFVEGTLGAPTRCRLSDFGLAFMLDPPQDTLGRFTVEGVLLGTPLYMAPEQAEGRAVGPGVDVYALGCMIHEMLSGRPPFVGNVARVLAGHAYLPPISLRELDAEIPQELEALVLEMLAKDAGSRPSADEVATRLRELGEVGTGKRSTTLQPRLARAFAPVGEREAGAPARRDLRLESDDPALAEQLRAHGVTITDDARVVLTTSSEARDAIAIRLLAAPTASDLAVAIRHGLAGVARWPGPIEPLLAQLARVWRRTP